MSNNKTNNAVFDATGWWEEKGKHRLLHTINPTRVTYIDEQINGVLHKNILDVGCGGGILTESLAKQNADVTGIDIASAAIDTAIKHAKENNLNIDYQATSIEEFTKINKSKFDAVVCMEMLEHVYDPKLVISQLVNLLTANGSLLLSTINRTPMAYAIMIVGLEKITNLIPRGTHDYEMFLKPSEVAKWCKEANLDVVDIVGVNWHFFARTFKLSHTNMPMNYFIHAKKKS